MTPGFSGTYGINGVTLSLSPSNGKWVDMSVIGEDGYGRPVYPTITEFEMEWDLMSPTDLKQLNDAYLFSANTGTIVADLPKWGDANYLFYSYSGTFANRPTVGMYFAEYVRDVKFIISNVRVT